MTRKDYELLAHAIVAARQAIIDKEPAEDIGPMLDGSGYVADYIADALAADNPRFNKGLFLRVAGIT